MRIISNVQENLSKELEASFEPPFMQMYSIENIFFGTKNIAHYFQDWDFRKEKSD